MDTRDGSPVGADFYLMDELLTGDEIQIRDQVRSFCDKVVVPVINDYWERAEFPFELLPALSEPPLAPMTARWRPVSSKWSWRAGTAASRPSTARIPASR